MFYILQLVFCTVMCCSKAVNMSVEYSITMTRTFEGFEGWDRAAGCSLAEIVSQL